jgi:sulfur-oxidizing protein SoxY
MKMERAFRSGAAAVVIAAYAALMGMGFGPATAAEEADIWLALQADIFGTRTATEATDKVVLEAPYRAEDAALVPITMRVPAAVAATAKKLTLIIDKNPAPVVAEFTFGPAAGDGERVISTRVRVDMYSNVRAVLETNDGALYMATKFVKAAGGCSAPALKDTDAVLALAGKMQIKTFDAAAAAPAREGQLMIRHPQYSGLQLNQATGYYIPAKFIRQIDVTRGSELVFHMEGGISLSEDPNIRFTFAAAKDETLEVTAQDTDGRTFKGRSAGPKGS